MAGETPGPSPDETAFNNMQIAAAAAGPEAEARRTQMGNWAEAQGALAESQAMTANSVEADVAKRGLTPDQATQYIHQASESNAAGTLLQSHTAPKRSPEAVPGNVPHEAYNRSKDLRSVYVKAVEGGVQIVDATKTAAKANILPSPANIVEPKATEPPVAA